MEFLNNGQLKLVAGASGAYDPAHAGASAWQSQHGYGGQANGFAGTKSNCLDLVSVIRDNPCTSSLVTGIVSGSNSWAGLVRGIISGAIGCAATGNGNGGGTGSNYGGQCTW
ncbi:hypothetical protein [uncultured Pantoea sp.]|uniref:hypothetical protein n=1 Tax=uncultured Pantoea sp. TaxID=218084 RepID=UPI0025895965|nr:hypothetical protein [uncultured Pantoea sp.]